MPTKVADVHLLQQTTAVRSFTAFVVPDELNNCFMLVSWSASCGDVHVFGGYKRPMRRNQYIQLNFDPSEHFVEGAVYEYHATVEVGVSGGADV